MTLAILPGTNEDRDYINDQIIEFNSKQVPFTQSENFINIDYIAKDEQKIVGGITAILYCWNCLYIDVLWMDEDYRHQGFGAQLLKKVEEEAIKSECHLSHLDTFDFQAKDFYLKNGYEIFGELQNCPSGHTRFYLKKNLKNQTIKTGFEINYENNPSREDTNLLWKKITEIAIKTQGHKEHESFGFFIRDNNNQIIGGCNGFIFYGCLHLDQLWVEESLRGKGYGTKLTQSAEKLAESKGCLFMTVNTMHWEALDFYIKLGFKVEFERHGFEKNSIFYFLRKEIIQR